MDNVSIKSNTHRWRRRDETVESRRVGGVYWALLFAVPVQSWNWESLISIIHRVRKKGTNSILGITSSNTDRFSQFFHFYNILEICHKAVIKYPIAPKMRHYTTLWNTDVRKLASWALLKDKLARIWRVADNSCILKWNLFITTYFTNLLYQFSILFVIISRRFFS